METHNQAEIFEILKRALKAQRITYAELAKRMDISEPTIKRLFSEKDCKFSRLIEICDVLELSAVELLEAAARSEDHLDILPSAIELAFADHPALFHLFILLKHGIDSPEIQSSQNLTSQDMFLYGQELEKLGLATLDSHGAVHLRSKAPFKIAPEGPLRRMYRDVNVSFVDQCYKKLSRDNITVRTLSRKMRPETAKILRKDIMELFEKITKYARQDRLMSKPSELETFKWLTAAGPALFENRIKVSAHRNLSTSQPIPKDG